MVSHSQDLPAVLARLERLERQSRWLNRCALAMALTLGAVLLMGQATPKPRLIEAEKFVVTDTAGKKRASFGLSTDGEARLDFYDDQGQDSRMYLLVPVQGEPRISLNGGRGTFFTSMTPHWIGVQEETTGRSVSLSIRQTGEGFSLDDGTSVRASFSLLAGGPALTLSNKKGNLATNLFVTEDGPSLELADDQGYSSVLGVTGLVTPATGESHKTSAASLAMFDNRKSVIWKAP